MQTERSIAIVGGGPGGLTLARLLATRGISATVFELDEHPLARPQGGSLDLHGESGLRALGEAGLMERFAELARYEDQGDAIYDQHGVLRYAHTEASGASGGDRPEIDRTQLRALLLESLPPDTVRWGSKIAAIEPAGGGRHRVMGEAGSLGEFDLVVGADGAWSRVRPLLSTIRPAYTGVLCYELEIDEIDARHPQLAAMLPAGKLSAAGDRRSLIAQRSSNGHVRVYAMFQVPEAQLPDFVNLSSLTSPAHARAALIAHLPGWAPSLLAFLEAAGDRVVPRPIVALPVGHGWSARPGLTLLGDAAHVMPPFSGEGVNMAMLDALELALALASADAGAAADWSAAVASYEARMFERAAEAAAGAMEGLAFVSEHGLAHVLEHFQEMPREGASRGEARGEASPGAAPRQAAGSSARDRATA